MADPTQVPSDGPKAIVATLLLDRPANVDCRLLAKRIGQALEFDLKMAEVHKPDFPLVLVAGGNLVTGMRIDGPFPMPLNSVAQFAYWWPNATNDIARSTSFVIVTCSWSQYSRLHAHMRHLILVRELVEQLSVIGVLWGHVLSQADAFNLRANSRGRKKVVRFPSRFGC